MVRTIKFEINTPRRCILRNLKLFILALVCFNLIGCADIEVPKADRILKNPMGETYLQLGMTKEQVLDIYSEPTSKNVVVSSEWKGDREEWYYKARYGALVVGAGYLTEDLYLYFDGDNLTNISRTKLGQSPKITKEEEDIK